MFIPDFVYSTANKSQSGLVCQENSTMTQFTTLEIGKWYTVLLRIHARSSNTKISKSWMYPLMITKMRQLRSLTPISLKRKENNSQIYWPDPGYHWKRSQQVNQVNQKQGSVWVSYPAVSSWRHSIFLIQDGKGQFLSDVMKDKWKDCTAKLLNKLKRPVKPNMFFCFVFFFFSDEKKFLLWSDGKLTEQPLVNSIPIRYIDSDEKQTPNPHHDV